MAYVCKIEKESKRKMWTVSFSILHFAIRHTILPKLLILYFSDVSAVYRIYQVGLNYIYFLQLNKMTG